VLLQAKSGAKSGVGLEVLILGRVLLLVTVLVPTLVFNLVPITVYATLV